jgi:hypothetical protein
LRTDGKKFWTELRMDYQQIIEAAGAEYIGVRGNSVLFRDPLAGGVVLSLYCFALRSVRDVELALKNAREKVFDFESLHPAEAL